MHVRSAALPNHVAITHIRCDGNGTGLTDPIPPQKALFLAVQMRPLKRHDLWLDGRSARVKPYQTGALSILDMECMPCANLASDYECIQFYFSRGALNEMSELEGRAPLGAFPIINGGDDPVLAHWGQLACMALTAQGPATAIFIESMLYGIHKHLRKQYYGEVDATKNIERPALLAQWQLRRVTEFVEVNLESGISLATLAKLCNLSASYFSKAFKATTGVSPHRWVVDRRIERAKSLLMNPVLSLAEVAVRCGFYDQSHLSREFRRSTGKGPAAWKRDNLSEPLCLFMGSQNG